MTDAVIVNLYDVESTGEALHMPLDERHARWRLMYDDLCRYEVAHWMQSFLDVFSRINMTQDMFAPEE